MNCDRGQLLNRALSKLDKHTPATVLVQGTCTEYVQITGFEDLTVKGLPGATLAQPATIPTIPPVALLLIDTSRSVVIDGLNVNSTPSSPNGIGVGSNGIDVRLRNLTVAGGGALVVPLSPLFLSSRAGFSPRGIRISDFFTSL